MSRLSNNLTLTNTKMPEFTEKEWKPTKKELLIMVTMAVCSLLVALDATILVPVLPTMAVDLKESTPEAFWTGTSYLLAHSVLQPFIASLSDIFGRRELLVPSILFFAVGSVVCGLAHSFKIILVGRVLQGSGGAGIITLSQLVFADMIPLRFRPKYFTMVLGAWALGSLLGPLIGGILVEKATWRWCFYLNLPICAVALPMATYFLGQLNETRTDLVSKLRSVDWIGNFLFICSITSFLIAVSWAGISYEWSDWQTIVPLVLGGLGIVITIAYERFLARHPFLTKSLFATSSAIASYVAAMFQGLALYMLLYYFSFYFSAVRFFSPIRTGLALFPATTLMLPGSAVVSALITRYGKFRWAIWGGFIISTLSSGICILWDDGTTTPIWAACECLLGLGMGMILSSINVAIQTAVDPEDAGQAAAMYAFSRSIGMTIGVAIGGTVFQNVMKGKLEALGVPDAAAIAKNAEAYIQEMKKMIVTVGRRNIEVINIMQGYVHGFRGVCIVLTGLCGAGLIASLFIKRGSLDKALKSKFYVQQPPERLEMIDHTSN